jgi:uncharacterized protein
MTKQVTIDGVSVELTDTTAQIVQRALAKYNDDFEEFKKKLSEKEKAAEEEKKKSSDAAVLIVTKDTQIKELQDKLKAAELTPEMMDAALMDRVNVIQKAKAILGDKLVTKDKLVRDIRRQVVDARLGDIAKAYSDEHVQIAFDTLSADVKATAGQGTSGLQQAFSAPRMPTTDSAEQAYDEYCRDLSNAWQKKSTVGQVN